MSVRFFVSLFLRSFLRSVQVCLELSIFIILDQTFKLTSKVSQLSLSSLLALSQLSFSSLLVLSYLSLISFLSLSQLSLSSLLALSQLFLSSLLAFSQLFLIPLSEHTSSCCRSKNTSSCYVVYVSVMSGIIDL